jgi:hypothetical protein
VLGERGTRGRSASVDYVSRMCHVYVEHNVELTDTNRMMRTGRETLAPSIGDIAGVG